MSQDKPVLTKSEIEQFMGDLIVAYPLWVPYLRPIRNLALSALDRQGWISVEERLPRSGTFVLMYAGEVYCASYGSNALTAPHHFSFCGQKYYPTHWMSLPPAPEKP